MAIQEGTWVTDPRDPSRKGLVLRVHRNPACLMRSLEIQWSDAVIDEWEEIEFGPLED